MDAQTLNQILGLALTLFGQFRSGRDKLIEAGTAVDPITGELKTNAELIALLQGDAQALQAEGDRLLAKHTAAPPAPPAEPPG